LAPVVRANYPFRPSIREDSANSVRIQGPSTADERAELESILASAGKDTEPELEAKTDDQVSTRLTARDIERLERKRKRSKLSPVEEKDLRLKTLVSELVKQRLSIQKAPIDRETYKKYAREVSGTTCVATRLKTLISRNQCAYSTISLSSFSVPILSSKRRSVAKHMQALHIILSPVTRKRR
jgi:hypothetical protein